MLLDWKFDPMKPGEKWLKYSVHFSWKFVCAILLSNRSFRTKLVGDMSCISTDQFVYKLSGIN